MIRQVRIGSDLPKQGVHAYLKVLEKAGLVALRVSETT